MKKIINKSLLIMFVLVVFACSEDETVNYEPQSSPFSISVEGGVVSIPIAGSNVNVNISAGTNGWWIVVPDQDKSWCVISKVYGSGDYKLPVTFKPNATGAVRTVSVTFNPTFGLAASNMTFTQNAN